MTRPLLLALLAFVVVAAATVVPIYFLAIAVSPPRTPDGHPVMPIGHVAYSVLAAANLGVIAATVVFRRYRARDAFSS